jgi:hypothetical protein
MRGFHIEEVPIGYAPRTLEQGKKISAVDGITAIVTLCKMRVRHLFSSPFMRAGGIVEGTSINPRTVQTAVRVEWNAPTVLL